MIFIDGSWFAYNRTLLMGDDQIDYDRFPIFLTSIVAEQFKVPLDTVDRIRTFYFTSTPDNYDPADEELVSGIRRFHDLLREIGYELIVYPLDYRSRRIQRQRRKTDDLFTPKEKCVDVALSTQLVLNAALGYFDVAVVVVGDMDFVPALKAVRSLGKRVMIVTVRENCSGVYKDPFNKEGVRDVPTVYLDDCKTQFIYTKPPLTEADEDLLRKLELYRSESGVLDPGIEFGVVTRKIADRGFGFIDVSNEGSSFQSFFFHISSCRNGDWEHIQEGSIVKFSPYQTEAGDKQAREVVFVN